MKKRLLSMLMAVLMIASLVPATALADTTTCDHADGVVISIKKDAAAKQPGIEVVLCNDCQTYDVKVVKFAKDRDTCKVCKNPVTKEIVAASCELPGVTITYCGDCGKPYGDDAVEMKNALGHNYDTFKVVKAPTCQKDGWGYALCKNCGEPVFITSAQAAARLVNRDNFKTSKEYEARVSEVYLMFASTKYDHSNKDALTAITKETEVKFGEDTVTLYPETKAFHAATVTDEETGKVTYVEEDKDGNTIYGEGYTGDYVCPNGDYVLFGEEVDPLNWQHAEKMAIVKYGELPGIDEDGDPYDGVTDTIKCGVCGKTYGGEKIPFVAEYPMVVNATKATCTDKGYTGDTYMLDAAGKPYMAKKGTEIPALGHKWVAVEGKDATCYEDGYTYANYFKCANKGCDAHKGDAASIITIPAAHKYVRETYLAPTCKNQGLVVVACSVCGDVKDWYYASKVACVAADELKGAKDATCTEAGYTGDSVCKWCGKLLKAGEEIPALGHKTEVKDAKAATCTEAGYTGDEVCTVCGETVKKGEEIAALGHKYENGVCTVCGEKEPVVAPEFKDAASIRDYAKDAVAWAAKEGIVKGDDNGNFLPTADITRQDFVTMLWRLKGSVASEKALTFGDKADIKDYAQTAVAWAVENGYIKGRDNGNFDPAAKITRAEIVAILNRIAENAKAEKAADFTDIATHWAKDAIAWAAEAGIVNGVGNNMFAPNDSASRQDTVVMLYKFVNLK